MTVERNYRMADTREAWFWSQLGLDDEPSGRGVGLRKSSLPPVTTEELRISTFGKYGGGKCACVRCGFDDIRALSLDHINGRNRDSGKRLKAGGVRLYYMLRNRGYPPGYQTLCMNCQWIKREENQEGGGNNGRKIE